MKNTRPISWIKAARRDFEEFPEHVQRDMLTALTIAAEGKNLTTPNRSRALTAVYLKSKTGIKTPPMEIDLIRERLKQLKEALK